MADMGERCKYSKQNIGEQSTGQPSARDIRCPAVAGDGQVSFVRQSTLYLGFVDMEYAFFPDIGLRDMAVQGDV